MVYRQWHMHSIKQTTAQSFKLTRDTDWRDNQANVNDFSILLLLFYFGNPIPPPRHYYVKYSFFLFHLCVVLAVLDGWCEYFPLIQFCLTVGFAFSFSFYFFFCIFFSLPNRTLWAIKIEKWSNYAVRNISTISIASIRMLLLILFIFIYKHRHSQTVSSFNVHTHISPSMFMFEHDFTICVRIQAFWLTHQLKIVHFQYIVYIHKSRTPSGNFISRKIYSIRT